MQRSLICIMPVILVKLIMACSGNGVPRTIIVTYRTAGGGSNRVGYFIHLSSAPQQAQIAVICVPRLASAEQQRSAQDGDLA